MYTLACNEAYRYIGVLMVVLEAFVEELHMQFDGFLWWI
jgi:hypothetical protein